MGKIYAGTSGWAYASWKPEFYPAKLGAPKFLNHYSSRLNSVEVNYSFSKRVSEELLLRWAEATPADFLFSMKAHRLVTHIKRLREPAGVTAEFLKSLEPLREAKKLGPVLFQLPPNFKCDLARLQEFLAGLPQGLRAAIEFRHESWFCEEVYDALRKAEVALCLAESEDVETPSVQTANYHYLRLRKEKYSAKAVAQKAERLAKEGDVFVYFKHEDSPDGALMAEKILALTKGK
jgi:uncharacterized protein YecE (DUF72 family)